MMDVNKIKEKIRDMFCDKEFGFEVYIFMKDESLRHFLFSDKKRNKKNVNCNIKLDTSCSLIDVV